MRKLAVSHTITRTGKRKDHPDGMVAPQTDKRGKPGYNSWMNLIWHQLNSRR